MNKNIILLTLLAALPLHAENNVEQLTDQVMQAAGYAYWPEVKRIQFTFRVIIDGQEKVSAKHDWNIAANTDIVTWENKTIAIDLTKPGKTKDDQAAFARWTNDTYWLIAPLKLKDKGTQLTQPVENQLELSFQQVGLTPGDRYIFEIDPATHLTNAWTYMPNHKTKKVGTWEKYVTQSGLTLSTYHKMGNIEIYIDNLKVTSKL